MKPGDPCPRYCNGKLYVEDDELKCIICHRTFGPPNKPQIEDADIVEEEDPVEAEEIDTEPVAQEEKPQIEAVEVAEPEEKVCTVVVKEDTLDLLQEAGVVQELEEPMELKKRGPYNRNRGMDYYNEHIEEIRADYNNPEITVPALLNKWSIPKHVWPEVKELVVKAQDSPNQVSEQVSSILGPKTGTPTAQVRPVARPVPDRELLEGMSSEQRREYYEIHKERVIADSEKMRAQELRKLWLMGEKMWLKIRHEWNIPIVSSYGKPNHLIVEYIQLVDEVALECKTIEEFRAYFKGYKRAKGWEID